MIIVAIVVVVVIIIIMVIAARYLSRLKKPPEEEEEVSPDGSWTCAVRGEGATFTGFSLFPALRLCWG
ncbi:unnamed protein product [Lampetra planeri]